ncbi:hypothetical protein J6590_026745 [Homalodisca vitripennis]|nr:hypothetical protein J6590_026745 [Homalodisca vitripennis]
MDGRLPMEPVKAHVPDYWPPALALATLKVATALNVHDGGRQSVNEVVTTQLRNGSSSDHMTTAHHSSSHSSWLLLDSHSVVLALITPKATTALNAHNGDRQSVNEVVTAQLRNCCSSDHMTTAHHSSSHSSLLSLVRDSVVLAHATLKVATAMNVHDGGRQSVNKVVVTTQLRNGSSSDHMTTAHHSSSHSSWLSLVSDSVVLAHATLKVATAMNVHDSGRQSVNEVVTTQLRNGSSSDHMTTAHHSSSHSSWLSLVSDSVVLAHATLKFATAMNAHDGGRQSVNKVVTAQLRNGCSSDHMTTAHHSSSHSSWLSLVSDSVVLDHATLKVATAMNAHDGGRQSVIEVVTTELRNGCSSDHMTSAHHSSSCSSWLSLVNKPVLIC